MYSLLYLCWHNHRQMTNGFFQYFRTNAFPTQRPKFWVDLQDPFPTNLRHKGGHFSLLPTYIRWKMVSVAKSNSFKWYHEHSEKTKFKHGMLCSYSSLFGLLKNSFPTENHFCVKLQWVRRLSQCSEKNQVEMRLAKTIGPTFKRVFVTNLKGFWWVNLCSIASNNEHSRCKD